MFLGLDAAIRVKMLGKHIEGKGGRSTTPTTLNNVNEKAGATRCHHKKGKAVRCMAI